MEQGENVGMEGWRYRETEGWRNGETDKQRNRETETEKHKTETERWRRGKCKDDVTDV